MEKIEIEFKDLIIEAEVYAEKVDTSFSHEFGIKKQFDIEITDIYLTAYDEDGEVVEIDPNDKKEIEELVGEKFYNSI